MKARIVEQIGSDGNLSATKTITKAVFHKGIALDEILESNGMLLKDKRIAFLGDSITQGVGASSATTNYVFQFEKLTGCVAINKGVSATRMAKKDESDTSAFINRVASIPDDIDALVILGGVNDYNQNYSLTPFGSFSDGIDESKYTFYSGVHCLFKACADKFVKGGIPVIVVTPLHFNFTGAGNDYTFNADGTMNENKRSNGKNYKDYVSAIKEIANYYSFPIIDAYSESNLNPNVDESMFADNLHPSDAGHLRLAKYLIPKVKAILAGM